MVLMRLTGLMKSKGMILEKYEYNTAGIVSIANDIEFLCVGMYAGGALAARNTCQGADGLGYLSSAK